jgi:hypothetical protein
MNAIIPYKQLTPDIWSTIQAVAPVMKDSRLFGVTSDSQAAAIMAKGYELGLSLTASFEFVTVIESKPALIPRGALALIYQSGLLEQIKITDDGNTCTVYMKRKGGWEFSASFGMDDAKAAGLIKEKSGWEKYPKQMRQWRAIGFAADLAFPDVLGGLKRADEYGADLTQDGNIVEGSWTPAPVATVQGPQDTPAAATVSLNDLLNLGYKADQIIAANNGKIPGSAEELEAVERKLRGE